MKTAVCSFCENELDGAYCRHCRNSVEKKLENKFCKELAKYKRIVGGYGKISIRNGVISISTGQNIVEIYAQNAFDNKCGAWRRIGQICYL